MAKTMGGTECKYCWRPVSDGGHNYGCPDRDKTERAMKEWLAGFQEGWSGIYHTRSQAEDESPSYRLGYMIGENATEEAIDEAYTQRMFDE